MSPETTLILILVFGTAAIASSLIVLKTWLLERRMPRVAWGWAMCTTALLVTSLFAAHYSAPQRGAEYVATRRVTEPDVTTSAPWYRTAWLSIAGGRSAEQSRVDEMHRQFAPVLERYRQTHGAYPPTLEDAGIKTPVTRYGPLHYYGSRGKSDPWYLISFGDIERDRFSADWDSRKQAWSMVELDF